MTVLLAASLGAATSAAADCTTGALVFTSIGQTITFDAKQCDPTPTANGYAGIHFQGENVNNYYGIGWNQLEGDRLATTVSVGTGNATYGTYSFIGTATTGSASDNTFSVTLSSIAIGAGASDTITVYTCLSWTGSSACNANDKIIIPVTLNIPPTTESFTASSVNYGSGASTITLSSHVSGNPTNYAVVSPTTKSGTVSVTSAGVATYTPAANARGNDTFTYTATNGQGTSTSSTVTVPIGNPTFSVTLPSSTGNVGVAYNTGAAAVTMSGGTGPYSNFSATGLPSGLSMNTSGVISGTPTAATTATVTVTATDSSNTAYTGSAQATLTISALPTVTSISPTSGPTAGGTTVVITGSGFSTANATGAVLFGAATATYTINSNTQITATSPAQTAGTYNVTVTNPNGTSAASTSDQFTYVAPPTVTAVSPSAGPTGGTTTVIITGTNLLNATAVTFGGTAATGYTVNGATQITATAPAGSAGTVDVRVTTVGGTSATSSADYYTYVAAPTINAVSPTAGPTGGGTTVVISGSGFSAAPTTGAVKFGASSATYTINSNTQITATSPANSAGTYDVTVTTPGGTSATSSNDQFTYVSAPTVTAVSPNAGSTNGNQTVVITGTNLSGATNVVFGATSATGYTINSATQITATSPAGSSGTLNVRVTTVGGTSPTAVANQYTYVAAPIGSSQTYGSIVAYNDGSNLTTNIDVSLYLTGGDPATSYAVGSATTAQGGSVSVNSSGIVTYTPPVGYRNANDSFTYTATNAGGASAPATVTVTIGNPTITLTLPSSTGTVERVYNSGGDPVTFSGGRATYTVNSISGLPSGLTDAGGGVISGTPAVNGVFTVTVNVTDSSLGAGSYNANTTANLTVSLPPAPVASSFSITGVGYNSGSATATTFSAAPHATESPTGYQVGGSSYSGTVSVDSAGLMSYTPPDGFRGTDTFNWVATNAGGTSNVGQVFVTVDDPVFSATLPASTGT
ncbi:MAG: IPT/TIG domain-containing protein, partial [Caulobacter sp.]